MMQQINNPPDPAPAGLMEALEASGHFVRVEFNASRSGVVWQVDDAAAVQAIVSGYAGSARQLAWAKGVKQQQLDDFLDQRFDLLRFIRGGNATGLTGANVGNFLAAIANNYRTLRASIAGAANVAQVVAVDVTSGWPGNP